MNSLEMAGSTRLRTVSSILMISTARIRKDKAIQGLLGLLDASVIAARAVLRQVRSSNRRHPEPESFAHELHVFEAEVDLPLEDRCR
jgi:hypothetical protein